MGCLDKQRQMGHLFYSLIGPLKSVLALLCFVLLLQNHLQDLVFLLQCLNSPTLIIHLRVLKKLHLREDTHEQLESPLANSILESFCTALSSPASEVRQSGPSMPG